MNKPTIKQLTLPSMPQTNEEGVNWSVSTVNLPNNTTSVIRTKKRP